MLLLWLSFKFHEYIDNSNSVTVMVCLQFIVNALEKLQPYKNDGSNDMMSLLFTLELEKAWNWCTMYGWSGWDSISFLAASTTWGTGKKSWSYDWHCEDNRSWKNGILDAKEMEVSDINISLHSFIRVTFIYQGWKQDCGNSLVNALELPQFCAKPLIRDYDITVFLILSPIQWRPFIARSIRANIS